MSVIVYVTAEIGLSTSLPTYSGGLGVLAGDHAKAAADLGLPFVAVSLFYHQGYGLQSIDAFGEQHLDFPLCPPSQLLEDTGVQLALQLEDEVVQVKVWRYHLDGRGGQRNQVLLLDTLLEDNSPHWQAVSRMLYGGNHINRLRQEAVLGIGGHAAIKALGLDEGMRVHLNEGHTAFFAAAMLAEMGDVEAVRQRVHFTTHTPVPAGHDHFEHSEIARVLGDLVPPEVARLGGEEELSMSHLASALASTCNGVSELNARVASDIFPGRKVDGLTNGIHFDTWVSPYMEGLFDRHLAGWRDDPEQLARIVDVPDGDFDMARRQSKRELLSYLNGATQRGFADDVLTIGFARRTVPYKRATLIFADLERLLSFSEGRLQLIFAGKAHPNDRRGQSIVRELVDLSRTLHGRLRIVFLPNYNMWLGRLLTSGVDIWLNNPVRPLEACGTSGMKAALNGVPNLSALDGWWAEICRDDVNGWAIGQGEENRDDLRDADALYRALEHRVLPLYYDDPAGFRAVRKQAIASAPFLSARRMVQAYDRRYYQAT